MKKDWIAAIEAGYSLGGSDENWLDQLLGKVSPLIDQGSSPIAWLHRDLSKGNRRLSFSGRVGPEYRRWIRLHHSGSDRRLYDLLYGQGRCLGTVCEHLFPVLPAEHAKFEMVTGGRMSDLLLSAGFTGNGASVVFAAYSKSRIRLRASDDKRWRQLGAHLGAGMRLRELGHRLCMEQRGVEAVFEPGGRVQDARSRGRDELARTALQQAVRRMDRARCAKGRVATDEALDNWQALVLGRWSLVEHFDSDGRRYVLAVRNDPAHLDPRGLTQRERQVAEYIGMGYFTSQIAYTLGISSSTVTDCSTRVQRKLGLSSRVELAAFFAPNGLRAQLAKTSSQGNSLLIGSYPLIPEERVDGLTEAEHDVLADLLAGSTNADIARRRRSSERTVANQIQAIFRKIGVRSRSELAVRLQHDTGKTGSCMPLSTQDLSETAAAGL